MAIIVTGQRVYGPGTVPDPDPDPEPTTLPNEMWMGCSDSPHDHGGTENWDGWRVYRRAPMYTLANRTGANKPIFLAYSEDGPNIGGASPNYNTVYNYVRDELDIFYYGSVGSNTPHPSRSTIHLFWSNGNENHDKGALQKAQGDDTPHTDAQVAAYLVSMSALYDAVHYINPATGERKYPLAYAGSNPTHDAEGRGIVEKWLHATAHKHDFVMWSMYPPGRKQTVSDPTFNWPSFNDSAATRDNGPAGFMIRTFYRTAQARAAARARADTPDDFELMIGTGEIGIGDDPGDSTTRPYYAVHGLALAIRTMADQYDMPLPFACWWDNELNSGPQNILSDEPVDTSPSTREAWQNWRDYCHQEGGTHPATWAGNPKSGWKTTGNVV